jgi:hypothetical protein
MIYCPQCRKAMEYLHTFTIQGAGPGQVETYVCIPCRVRCNRETTFHYDADMPASSLGKGEKQ